MKVKELVLACGGGVMLGLSSVSMGSEISANVTMATDYLFRGISQTDNSPTVQGGFDWAHDSGFYLGTWASNIAFADSVETDFYGGYGGASGDLSYDLSAVFYHYPSATDLDYWEIIGALGYDFGAVAVSGSIAYSWDFFDSTGTAWAYEGGLEIPLPMEFSLSGTIGYQDIDDNDKFGTDDYTYYSIGVSKDLFGVTLGLTWSDTDLGKSDCFGGDNICDSKLVASISKEF